MREKAGKRAQRVSQSESLVQLLLMIFLVETHHMLGKIKCLFIKNKMHLDKLPTCFLKFSFHLHPVKFILFSIWFCELTDRWSCGTMMTSYRTVLSSKSPLPCFCNQSLPPCPTIGNYLFSVLTDLPLKE